MVPRTFSVVYAQFNLWWLLSSLSAKPWVSALSMGLFSYDICSYHFNIYVAFHWPLSMSLLSPQLDTVLQVQPHQCCMMGKDHISWQIGNIVPTIANTISLLCCQGTLRTHFQLCSPGFPGPFLHRSFPAGWHPACPGAWRCSSLGAGLFISCWT